MGTCNDEQTKPGPFSIPVFRSTEVDIIDSSPIHVVAKNSREASRDPKLASVALKIAVKTL